MTRDFYITLPSNSSANVFPDNKATEYRTRLNQRITFTGDWEVTLVKITVPITWYNVPEGKNWYSYRPIAGLQPELPPAEHKIVKPGHYTSFEALLNSMHPYNSGYEYSILNNRIAFDKGSFKFCNRLADLLGVKRNRALQPGDVADFEADMNAFHHSVYVYGDFIEAQYVGDASVPLLQTVPLNSPEYGTYVTYSPRHLTYVPVLGGDLHSPLIYLRDHAGEKIDFNSGITTVLLHFREKL